RASLSRRCASALRSSAPPDGGTDDRPIDVFDPTIVMTYSPGRGRDRLALPGFDPPVVFQVRAAFRRFYGFVVIGRVDDEITAHYLFGFRVWAVDNARLAVAHRDVAAALLSELVASNIFAFGLDFAPPCDVFADNLLRLFGRKVREIGRRFAQK